jgi:DNA-directed RNA polymerase specialized sigma24 family protein
MKQGEDEVRFRALFDAHHRTVARALAYYGVSAADRPDLVQEVFLSVHSSLLRGKHPAYDAPLPVWRAWLRQFARRHAASRIELGALRFEQPSGVKATPFVVPFAGLGVQAGVEWFFSEHIALNGYAELRVSTRNPTELRSSRDHRIAWSSSRPSPGLGLGLVVSY